jgi:hypothetical protein
VVYGYWKSTSMTSGEVDREEAMSETSVKEYTEEEREDIVGGRKWKELAQLD